MPTWPSVAAGLHLDQGVGVDAEDLVHRFGEARTEVLVPEVAVAAARHLLVVGDVAGRLLEVGGEAAALQDLGEDVRDPFGGDVGAAELGDRVVPVAEEDTFVELGGAFSLFAVEGPARTGGVTGELVQVEAAEGSAVAGIA